MGDTVDKTASALCQNTALVKDIDVFCVIYEIRDFINQPCRKPCVRHMQNHKQELCNIVNHYEFYILNLWKQLLPVCFLLYKEAGHSSKLLYDCSGSVIRLLRIVREVETMFKQL